MQICSRSGKQIHYSRGEAQAQLRSILSNNNRNYDGKPYACIYCGGWHVGRRKKNARRNKYENMHTA